MTNENRRGKTWEEIFGEDKARKMKEKRREFYKTRIGKNFEEIYGLKRANEIKQKIRDTKTKLLESGKLTSWNKGIFGYKTKRKGQKFTEEQKIRLAEIKKQNKNSGMKGKHHNEETKKNISLKLSGRKLDKSTIEKCRIKLKERWKDPEYAKRVIPHVLAGLMKRPTSFEQKISDLCIEYNLPFLYKGDGNFLINFKNPDFVNEKDKVVIEVFYSWFKIRDYGSVENYKEFCKKKYESAGWKVIFIDELDLNSDNWKEVCLDKIKGV